MAASSATPSPDWTSSREESSSASARAKVSCERHAARRACAPLVRTCRQRTFNTTNLHALLRLRARRSHLCPTTVQGREQAIPRRGAGRRGVSHDGMRHTRRHPFRAGIPDAFKVVLAVGGPFTTESLPDTSGDKQIDFVSFWAESSGGRCLADWKPVPEELRCLPAPPVPRGPPRAYAKLYRLAEPLHRRFVRLIERRRDGWCRNTSTSTPSLSSGARKSATSRRWLAAHHPADVRRRRGGD
jgi:hypothetical protein